MKLDPYQLFSICTCIYFGLAKFFVKAYLVFKIVFMYSLITHQWKRLCPYICTRWQEYWNRESRWLFLLPSVNTLLFRKISTFTFTFVWFTWNYKDQTDSNSLRVASAHILFWKRVLQGDILRRCNLTLGSLYWGKNKTLVSSPESWFRIPERILTDSQISSIIKRPLIWIGLEIGVAGKNVPYRRKHTRIWYVLIFDSIRIRGKWTRNLRLYRGYLECCANS